MQIHKLPHVRVFVDNSCFLFTIDKYDAIRAAWMRGAEFYEEVSGYGTHVVIKFSSVVAIHRWPAEAISECESDNKEEDQKRIFDSE